MVFLNEMRIQGLLSYPDLKSSDNRVSFSKNTVIVGPNDAGKSNIFRIIRTLVDSWPAKFINPSDLFSERSDPSVELNITLSPPEANELVDFLGFYTIKKQNYEELAYHTFSNKQAVVNLVRDVRILFHWIPYKMNRALSETLEPKITIIFDKLNLKIIMGNVESYQLAISESDKKEEPSNLETIEGDFPSVLDSISVAPNPNGASDSFFEDPKKAVQLELGW